MKSCILLLALLFNFPTFAADCVNPIMGVRESIEKIGGVEFKVHKVSTGRKATDIDHPGALLDREPKIIIGVDASQESKPYLIIGHTMIHAMRRTRSSEQILIYQPALEQNIPTDVVTYTYHLEKESTDRVPPGTFVKLDGIDHQTILQMENGLDLKADFPQSNTSWRGMIGNLLDGLTRGTDIRVNCEGDCDRQAKFFKQAIKNGFTLGGKKLTPKFYIVDERSLAASVRRARIGDLREILSLENILFGTAVGLLGGASVVGGYEAAAYVFHWPSFMSSILGL